MDYPKRLIEVDLPIRRISAHARREKSRGPISTLHTWWARRPLVACRAVICAALWPDPADDLCPESFRETARQQILAWASAHIKLMSAESYPRFNAIARDPKKLNNLLELRSALLDFIADFADWNNSTTREYLDTCRDLTRSAHEALGGAPGTRPLVVDPFAGGGAIPLEALRVGADVFASDLNPVAVLLNRIVLEYIPKYGDHLAGEIRKWGQWVKDQAEKELAGFYPKDPDGATPIAYLWARTIQCEGPGCGAEVPLVRSLWLAKDSVALRLEPDLRTKHIEFQVIKKNAGVWVHQTDSSKVVERPDFAGTVRRGSATCPCCGYTTPVKRVSDQLRMRTGGTRDARLLAVVLTKQNQRGRTYRLPTDRDRAALRGVASELARQLASHHGVLSLLPDESLPPQGTLGFRVQRYGITHWVDLFTPRQSLVLAVLSRLVAGITKKVASSDDEGCAKALQAVLACAVDRQAEHLSSLCRWNATAEKMQATFGRQALPIVFDFCEASPFGGSVGSWENLIECVAGPFEAAHGIEGLGQVEQAPAQAHPLPSDAAAVFFTDPPYYDAIPYADLSDFFFVWLRRMVPGLSSSGELTPKVEECIVDESRGKGRAHYEQAMTESMAEGRRILTPDGIGMVVFAHKSTSGWEAQLKAMINAGWIVTGSWPIDTEMGTRLRAMDSAALASSVHLVCRPRENPDGSIRADDVGDWREVLRELPRRIHDWIPRLADEGVVGADAIFACLGPALEVFSRYSRVEKTGGEVVTLTEYLEHVWAAVSKEAISMIFREAETSGLEPDARLTAMWLWTLAAPTGSDASETAEAGTEEDSGDVEDSVPKAKTVGFVLEFDAARKIAQGLGAQLEELSTVVEVRSDKARLLSVGERAKSLFAKAEKPASVVRKKAAKQKQMLLFEENIEQAAEEQGWDAVGAPEAGKTALDRVHQAMLLFGTGRSEALKRFLVDEGVGRQAPFWKLAQALSALYPAGCDEKRWVDGVLARKKGLGF